MTLLMFSVYQYRLTHLSIPLQHVFAKSHHCYDWEVKRWCIVTGIEIASGRVKVKYDDNREVLVSPDHLVGGAPLASNDEQSVRPMPSQHTPSKRQKLDECYFGVHVYEDGSYIRGELRGSPPLLVRGESVTFPHPGAVKSEFLEWSSPKKTHLTHPELTTKIRKKFEDIARRGEKAHADKIREEHTSQRRMPRLTSRDLRRLQPVYVYVPKSEPREAIIIEHSDDKQVKVQYTDRNTKGLSFVDISKIQLTGSSGPQPPNLDDFFDDNSDHLPQQRTSYCKPPDYLLTVWEEANGELARRFMKEFERQVDVRAKMRALASKDGNGFILRAETARRLEARASTLLERLQSDFQLPAHESMMDFESFKPRILELKNMLTSPNWLLLCGGIAPEITAYKRLNAAPLGIVILQEIDLHAVGVAVAAHPDVHFAIACQNPSSSNAKQAGDIRILTNTDDDVIRQIEVRVGGIHSVGITNPCQSFSLAGKKDGFSSEAGRLLNHCFTILRLIADSSEMPMYLAENVPSTKEISEETNSYLPGQTARYFEVCGSMCAPSVRKRIFATNRPPVVCSQGPRQPGEPPSLNGDLPEVSAKSVVKDDCRMVNPRLKKFNCLTRCGPKGRQCVWELPGKNQEPLETKLTGDEAERAMGYSEEEIGVTARSAEKAVQKRIRAHNFEKDGCLVSLKGCADDKEFPPEPVDEQRRLELLGNSQIVTVLEALKYNDGRMFPPIMES